MHDRTMSIYAVTYDYSDDAALRDEHRASHREYLAGLAEEGIVLVSGPWGPDEAPGALLIFRGDSVDAVRELGQTVVMVTHELDAAAYADDVLVIADGEIRAHLVDPEPAALVSALRPGTSIAAGGATR